MKHNDHTIISVTEYQKQSPDCCHMINQSLEEATERSTTVTSSKSAGSRSSTSHWLLEDWISTLAKGGGAKKRFQYCVNPNSSNQFLYLRAVQGHSGDNVVDPALQDNVLLPKGFTEYLYQVGDANESNSMIRNGLIPGGKKHQERKTSGLLHNSGPDGGRIWHGGNSMRSDETKDRAIQELLGKRLQNTVFWCNLKLAQERGLQHHQTLSHAVVLHNTLLAACIEKAVCMKTQDELYQRVRLTPRVPRVVLKSDSPHGLQDPQNQDARSSWEPSSDSKSYGEICNNKYLEYLFLQSSRRIQHARTK